MKLNYGNISGEDLSKIIKTIGDNVEVIYFSAGTEHAQGEGSRRQWDGHVNPRCLL